METWKDIPGYEGFYQASNLGRIKSVPHRLVMAYRGGVYWTRSNILKAVVDKNYCRVMLSVHNKVKTYRVHRLVAMAFIGDPAGMDVNHIDGDGHNNCLENLEIIPHVENVRHAFKNGLIKDVCHYRGGWNRGLKMGPTKQQDCQERPCQQCGKIFLPFLKIQKHCSRKCSNRYGQLHRKKRDRSGRYRRKL
jgi:hypothetical protein